MNMTSIEKLKKAFEGDLNEYRSVPFWSWNNELEEDALVAQIDEMKKVGIGGFIMHARTGLTTEYLGEKWFACVAACLKRAKELGMNAWIYDENGWPSGFVGGKLLETEAYRARFLEYEVKERFDEQAFCVYVRTEDGYQRVSCAQAGESVYHCVYLRISPSNTDILNPEVVEAFLQETHEKYYERFQESFGRELVGFFTDEPQYYRWATPYPVKVADEFLRKYGEDVRDGLLYLFLHEEKGYAFRTRYFTTLNEMYVQTYYKRLYEWCEEHGCMLTGHSVEEPHLYTQMWGGGGVMPTYEYQHIPGIDSLGFQGEPVLSARQIGSVAAQLGKKHILTEIFGCGGYDITPAELCHAAEMQYFNGVNLMCQHLLPYSLAGQGKYDHPPVFYKQNNWWEESKEFNEYFTRLGYIIANTKDQHDVLVIHPMRCVYLDYIRAEDLDSVKKLEADFEELLATLNKNGILYHLADESLLALHGKIEDGKLVMGNCIYDKIILPKMPSIAASTLQLLQTYEEKLCILDEILYVNGEKIRVDLTSNLSMDEIISSPKITFQCLHGMGAITARAGELGEFAFVKNHSMTEPLSVSMPDADLYAVLNLETLETETLAKEFVLEKGAGLVLIKRENEVPKERKKGEKEDITANFRLTGMSENYLVMDRVRISFDGDTYGEEMPLPQVFENLLYKNYRGKIFVKHIFFVEKALPLTLMVEENRFISATLNGSPLRFTKSSFDVRFLETDISELIKEGENEYVYTLEYYQRDIVRFAFFDPLATEAVRNCLYYDTHLENAYLKGHFSVGKDGTIHPRKELPQLSSRWFEQGYPFFYGQATLCGTYVYDGNGSREISLKGRFAVANVIVNGKQSNLVLDTKKDITDLLEKGENTVCIQLKSSLRNLMGPHHNKFHRETQPVTPDIFTLYKTWKDGESLGYTKTYSLVPFGVDAIEIMK